MQGPGGRRPTLVRQGSEASSGSQRRASILSGVHANRAASCRSQSTTSDGKARGSLVGNKHAVRVFDDEGKDVTPRPLFHSDPTAAVPRQGKLLASSAYFGATGSGFLSSFSAHQTSGVNAGLGLLSRTYGSSSTSISNTSTTESILDEIVEPGSRQDTTVSLSDVQVKREEIKEELTKKDLERRVDIYLTETETIWILAMPPAVVSVESEDAGRVQERNRIYVDICKNRPGNDRFVEKMMQTINGAAKNKEVQCDKIIMEDKGMMVTSWDLYDSFNVSEIKPTPKAEGSRATTGKSSKSHTPKKHDQTTSVSSDRGSTTSTMIAESAILARIHKEKECHSEAILTSENFQQDLFFMERILMENIFQPKLAAYRQLPVLTDPGVTMDTSGTAAARKEAKHGEHDKENKKEEQKEAFIEPSVLSDLKKTPEEIVPPRMEWLWSYMCDLTNGHSVSSMAWSKANPDLLAVGYGAFHFKEQKKGLACCWSLKNPMATKQLTDGYSSRVVPLCARQLSNADLGSPFPIPMTTYPRLEICFVITLGRPRARCSDFKDLILQQELNQFFGYMEKYMKIMVYKLPEWPERIFRCEHGVTALDFSTANPNLLAVGTYNGSVTIYNVRSCKDAALLDSSESSNKHTGPVWQLRWVEQDRGATGDGKKETLICISADGRITEWLIQKRLDCTDLMKIKRTESEKKKLPGGKERKNEVLISQQAAGMCFDFHPKDANFYLAGTEEGHIHKCSCSCSEQFLETYRGHKGPVYKVAWNPFSTDTFLSCSADWSIILWHQDSQTPMLTFTSIPAFVHDIMWSPKSTFVFAAVNESRAEIWDLSVSTLNPVTSCLAKPGAKFTSVLFAKTTDCLLAGDTQGEVGVFELHNLATPSSDKVDTLHDIIGPALAL